MRFIRPALALLSTLAFAAPAAADVSGNFVVKLGQDTTSFEHYTRSATRLDIQQVGRAPRVFQRHLAYDYGKDGAVTHFSLTVTAPGAAAGAAPVQQIDAVFTADSMRMESKRDTTVQRSTFAVPAGALVWTGASPWSVYEGQTMKLAKQKGDSLTSVGGYLGSATLGSITARRLGRDSMVVQTTNDLYHVRVDGDGRILSMVPIIGTAKFSVQRVDKLDLAGMTAGFVAREQQAGAMGVLSPRDTVRAGVAGAQVSVDYSRPGKRGRSIFGGVVPWNVVWRTGANAATQFHTDKALQFGSNDVPAGTYTLWTLPAPGGWKFIVNSDTGEWGTEHKPEKDMFSVDMNVTSLPQPVERFTISVESLGQGGLLHLDWDTTRASVPFTVKP